MTLMLLRRVVNPQLLLRACNFCSRASTVLDKENEAIPSVSVDDRQISSANYSNRIHLSPLLSDSRPHSDGYDIEVVDHDTWQVSSGLAQAWQGTDWALETRSLTNVADELVDVSSPVEGDPDFDEIDNMRIRGNLFYKLDRDSKEFEEYNFDFHGKKSLKNIDDRNERKKRENPKNKDDQKGSNKENPSCNTASGGEKLPKVMKNKWLISQLDETDNYGIGKKKLRTPTFNQLTGPYHEPFCLDIYISKASVRACIVHRATSNVVAVAHSISKDMKFDLGSTRNATACAAVGGVLAQRALADDIHDVVYTPRKGEKLEGKLQIVLQSIIDNGVNVKVKLKQRRPKKADHASIALSAID